MSITRIDFPNAAPVDITDWEKIIDVAEFNTLGINNPVNWDFSSNTVKQGIRIIIGGTIYQVVTSEAITGTPSDFVKITPAGATAAAAYVASLAGVTWNSVYNHYEDVSGNAYLFNESKQFLATPHTEVGKFAQLMYSSEIDSGSAPLVLNKTNGQQVGIGNVTDFTSGVQTIILGVNEAGFITDAGSHGGGLLMIDQSNDIGAGGVIYFGSAQGDNNAVGYAAIKGYLTAGALNTTGHLDTYIRNAGGDTFLTLRERLTDTGNRLIGTIVDSGPRFVVAETVGSLPSIGGAVVALFQRNSATTHASILNIIAGDDAVAGLYFGDNANGAIGRIQWDNSDNSLAFWSSTEGMRLTAGHHLLVNTTSDLATFHVNGDARITGTLGAVTIAATGATLGFSRAGKNFINALTAGGSFEFQVNGSDVAMNINSDKSVTLAAALVVGSTIDTGQGANELYAMNQNVRTTDNLTFNNLTINGSYSPGASTLVSLSYDTSGVLIPIGVYQIPHTGSDVVQVQQWNGSSWVLVMANGTLRGPNMVFSDGVNMRLLVSSGSGSITVRKF